jgi:hypothetical protein
MLIPQYKGKKMKKILLSTLTTLALLTTAVTADEIIEQMNEAMKAYQDKDYKGAMDELKFITALLQKLSAAENQKLLPKPLEGWKKQESRNGSQGGISMLGRGGTSMQATYKKDRESVEIKIRANSPMIAMMSMAITNPALMASDPRLTPFRYKRNKGVKKKEGNVTEITLLISGQILVQVKGRNLKDDTVLEQYLDKIDFKELKSSLL